MKTKPPTRLFTVACGITAITAALYGFAQQSSAAHAKQPQRTIPVVEDTVTVNEASGVVLMEGVSGPGHTVLVEGNEKVTLPRGGQAGDKVLDIQMVRNADAPFAQKTADAHSQRLGLANLSIDDIEDIAWDRNRLNAYLIGSHSRNKRNEIKPNRRKLACLFFDSRGKLLKAEETASLEKAMRETFPFVPDALDNAPQEVGGVVGTLNIEGAVFAPGTGNNSGDLLLGLRSPLAAHNQALVLKLKNPHALFGNHPASPKFEKQPIALSLKGQGIRGMTYDNERKGCWIIAGRSAHDGTDEPWTLWFWKPDTGKLEEKKLPPLGIGIPKGTPEGICCLTLEGKPALLVVEDKNEPKSRYALFPKPPK